MAPTNIFVPGVPSIGKVRRRVLGGAGAGSPAFVPDTTPSAYRTTTQAMVSGRSGNAATGVTPQLSANFSVNVWARLFNAGGESWVFTLANGGGTANDVVAAGTAQAITLSYTGVTTTNLNSQNRFALCGIDKAGNKFNPTTLAALTTGGVTAIGYGILSEAFEALNGHTMLLTVQYRSGNIELWATARGQRPRLLIQQACTWTGTSKPMDVVWGGALTTSGNAGMEIEMPIVLPDRALSENEIAQLSLGISPENLNSASTTAQALLRFCSITNGTTASADTVTQVLPTDGQTVTVGGTVFTFRNTASLTNDVQIVAQVTETSIDTTANTITSPTCPANGTRVSIFRSSMPAPLGALVGYFVINSSNPGGAGTYQISLTAGGAAIDITSTGSGSFLRLGTPGTLDNLAAKVNAAGLGVTATTYNVDHLILTNSTAGGTSVTFDTTATALMPTNKRLALAYACVVDYTNFSAGLFGAPGMPRSRSAAWVTPTLGAHAPNTQVTGALLVNSWSDAQVTHSIGGTSYCVHSGIYTGNPPLSGGKVKIYDQNGGTQVQDFVSYTSFSIDTSAKTWTGKFTAPIGLRHCALETQKTGSTQIGQRSQVRFGFGKVRLLEGRSHMSDWLNTFAGNDQVPNGFCAMFNATTMPVQNGYTGFPLDGRWHRFDATTHVGAGVAVFTNKVAAALGCNVGIQSHALGGVSFATLNTPTYWQNRYNAAKNNTWGDESAMPLCDMGWTHSGEDYGTVSTGLCSQLRANWTTYFGTTSHAGLLGITPSTTIKDSVDGTEGAYLVRAEQLDYLASRLAANDPLIYNEGEYQYVFNANPPADGVHSQDIRDTKTKCDLAASAYVSAVGSVMDIAVGPTIQSISRTGAGIYDITWSLNTGATLLQTANPAANITGVDFATASSGFLALQSVVTADSTTDVVSFASNTPNNGDPLLFFHNGGSVPGGIPLATKVYARDVSANTCKIALTPGGAAVDITSNGSNIFTHNVRDLLVQSSHVITGNTTTRVTFATDPGAINLLAAVRFGRPGYEDGSVASTAFDPNSGDQRVAMTEKLAVAQANPLCDNYSGVTQFNTLTIGRLCKTTTTSFAFS